VTEAADPLLGTELDDRYRVVAPLGEGGMGAVYRGEHLAIGRAVAIKVLNPLLATSNGFAQRFEREAQAAGRLQHPNCVPVTDFGRTADGTSYLVMDLVEGRGLGEIIAADKPLDPPRALRIARHVLRGLGHAHASNVVHRDIKPDNIIVESHEDGELARVLDFGIAKLREGEGDKLTQAGTAIGTPSYLSPEQAVGGDIDHRCDLYSTAVVLFEMLTGSVPYTADTPLKVLTKHATAPLPALSDVAPHLADVPDLEALLRRGMAKDPDDRFMSAAEFVQAIDSCLRQLGEQLTPLPLAMPATPSVTTGTPLPMPATPTTGSLPASTPHSATALHTAEMTATGPAIAGARKKRGPIGWVLVAISISAIIGVISVGLARDGGGSIDDVIDELQNGKTCEDRRKAVEKLRAIGDPKAIPALRKARRRMRGGVAGFGSKNTNACLQKLAKETIKELKSR
jgi:serine/threonine-protein kinase